MHRLQAEGAAPASGKVYRLRAAGMPLCAADELCVALASGEVCRLRVAGMPLCAADELCVALARGKVCRFRRRKRRKGATAVMRWTHNQRACAPFGILMWAREIPHACSNEKAGAVREAFVPRSLLTRSPDSAMGTKVPILPGGERKKREAGKTPDKKKEKQERSHRRRATLFLN